MASADHAVVEEGSRHGREIAAQEDFMTVTVESAAGSLDALRNAMGAAQEAAKEVYGRDSESARKKPGMMFLSHGAGTLAIAACVPPERMLEV
eukprot:CAMPEP_0174917848 /NCGR_PEP_ID=MMETSP1355-20121228/2736_1 /TAXON_ID=464990 /ORGANISM="Hemiselmis tepida, Strain CCMP443" /LENGTH=92 /DNA_ID=CAMNT_0016162991 /DNA_START=229 /DNA_END=504 /DNA_ORIENTATION=-